MSGKKTHSNAALDSDKESETEEQVGTRQGVDQASTTPGGIVHCVPRVVVFQTSINFLGTSKVHRPTRGQRAKRRTGQGKGQSILPAKRSRAEKEDYVWSKDPAPVTVEPFLGSPGPTSYISDDPMTTFSSFFTDELLTTIAEETNRYAAQFASRQPSSNQREWKTSVEELKAYFGFMVLMGINQLPEI